MKLRHRIASTVAAFIALGSIAGTAQAALSGSCGIVATIPHPFLSPYSGLAVYLDVMAVINFDNSTINYNATQMNWASTATGQFSEVSGTTSFTTATGPITGSYTISFPVGSRTLTLNLLPVNSGSTILVQGGNDKIDGVCQAL